MNPKSPVEQAHERTAKAARERQVLVTTNGIRVEVRGMLAYIVAYLVSAPGLAADLEQMGNGSLYITWGGVGGNFRAKIDKYYPDAKSSNLMGESS